jgi:hypothetical protein
MRIVLGGIYGRKLALTKDITVDAASNVRKFSNADYRI